MKTDKSGVSGEPKLSKMQTVRKRELRRAMNRLHECITASRGDSMKGMNVYGLRVAITILGEMRKEINHERETEHV
jgi:hypothetical protein